MTTKPKKRSGLPIAIRTMKAKLEISTDVIITGYYRHGQAGVIVERLRPTIYTSGGKPIPRFGVSLYREPNIICDFNATELRLAL